MREECRIQIFSTEPPDAPLRSTERIGLKSTLTNPQQQGPRLDLKVLRGFARSEPFHTAIRVYRVGEVGHILDRFEKADDNVFSNRAGT